MATELNIFTFENSSACRRYKQCLQCVRMSNGDECIGENVLYGYDAGKCLDNGGSCGRGLCECDAAFAKGSFFKSNV